MSGAAARQVVIAGAGASGDAAAEGLRKAGFDGRVVLVGGEPHPAYHRPYLSKEFLRDELPLERLPLRKGDAYQAMDVEWLASTRVVTASARDRAVTLDDGRSLPFDVLVLATGGTPRWLPGIPRLSNVLSLRSLDDGIVLKDVVAASQRLLVIGAGFIGAEVAASARTLGKDALVVEIAPVPLQRALGDEMGEVYARLHRDRGVDLRTSTSVTEWVTSGDRVTGVVLSDGSREEVDAALVAVGIQPDIALATELGLPIEAGGVVVDEALSAAPGIYACGDIAAHLHPVLGALVRVEHWQVARKQGAAVGQAIATGDRPFDDIPWFWSDQYDVKLQYLGHAAQFDRAVWRGDRDGRSFSVWYLRGGKVDGVLAFNDARSIRFGRDLIRRRVVVAPEQLADESSDLKAMAAST